MPIQPSAPTPPPGGNIENRQPPAKPSAPEESSEQSSSTSDATKSFGNGNDPLSSFISSLDSEDSESIFESLMGLSGEGKDALKTSLEEFAPSAQELTEKDREEGFLEILNDIFTEYGGDYNAVGNILSTYA